MTATATVTGSSSGIGKLLFSLDGGYLLTDFESPYTYQLPTDTIANGGHTLSVVCHHARRLRDLGARRDAQLLQRRRTPAGPTFAPVTPGPRPAGQSLIMAAVGDGAGGESQRRPGHADDRRLEP